VGSADGYVYALALNDGRELWRLRVAPEEGRIMVYGQMGSRWPIIGSPLVVGDTVIASAGLVSMIDGVCAVCTDAASGRILWERSDWTASASYGRVSGGAQFALCGEEAYYHGGVAPPIRISLQDGTAGPALPPTVMQRLAGSLDQLVRLAKGPEIGALSPEWLMYGGRRIWTNQVEGVTATAGSSFKILGRDSQGLGRLPAIDVKNTALLPAWDDQDVLFACSRGCGKAKNLTGCMLISRQRLQEALNELMAGTDPAKYLVADDQSIRNLPLRMMKDFDPTAEGLASWNLTLPYGWSPLAYALSKNAALVATASWDIKQKQAKLIALNRADGKKMWEVSLPAQPVHNGLAVAADGSVVLTLIDGQTICVAAGIEK
jgi:outer membrane protein assembly factor BamB